MTSVGRQRSPAVVEATGAFNAEAEILPDLARVSAFRRYRRGDILLNAGAPTRRRCWC